MPNVLAFDKLEPEVNNFNLTPSYSLIQPNLCNSGAEDPCADQSEGGAARADEWLEEWVPKIQGTQAFKQGGLIVITFNETSLEAPTPNERVGTLLINRWLTPGSDVAAPHNPYSMLKTVEDLFGLNYLAAAALPRRAPSPPSCWGHRSSRTTRRRLRLSACAANPRCARGPPPGRPAAPNRAPRAPGARMRSRGGR